MSETMLELIVEELNTFIYEKKLRRYQELIIDNKQFKTYIDGNNYMFFRAQAEEDCRYV